MPAACATYAEVSKRGKEFWNEFEYYLSDLTVGLVLDVLLVGLMATPAVIGKHHAAHNATGNSPMWHRKAAVFASALLSLHTKL